MRIAHRRRNAPRAIRRQSPSRDFGDTRDCTFQRRRFVISVSRFAPNDQPVGMLKPLLKFGDARSQTGHQRSRIAATNAFCSAIEASATR